MKKIVCLPVMFLFAFSAFAQPKAKVENIIMITIDGCRWQEVFGGADSVILFNDKFRKKRCKPLNGRFQAKTPKKEGKTVAFMWVL